MLHWASCTKKQDWMQFEHVLKIKTCSDIMRCHRYRGTSQAATVDCVYRKGEVSSISVLHSPIDI